MPAGRPTELTPEVIREFQRLLPTVLYLETVADYLALDRTTIRKWIRRGAKEAKRIQRPRSKPKPKEALYLEFFLTYKKGLAEGQIYDLGIIKKASEKQWTAAAWRLERRFPHLYGSDRREIQEIKKQLAQLEAKSVSGTKRSAKQARQVG
jgi:hypothetical protein